MKRFRTGATAVEAAPGATAIVQVARWDGGRNSLLCTICAPADGHVDEGDDDDGSDGEDDGEVEDEEEEEEGPRQEDAPTGDESESDVGEPAEGDEQAEGAGGAEVEMPKRIGCETGTGGVDFAFAVNRGALGVKFNGGNVPDAKGKFPEGCELGQLDPTLNDVVIVSLRVPTAQAAEELLASAELAYAGFGNLECSGLQVQVTGPERTLRNRLKKIDACAKRVATGRPQSEDGGMMCIVDPTGPAAFMRTGVRQFVSTVKGYPSIVTPCSCCGVLRLFCAIRAWQTPFKDRTKDLENGYLWPQTLTMIDEGEGKDAYKEMHLEDLDDEFIDSLTYNMLDKGLRSPAADVHAGCAATPGTQYNVFDAADVDG